MNQVKRNMPKRWLCPCYLLLFLAMAGRSHAESFTINTPGGPVTVEISHVGPKGSLVGPSDPESPAFRPPSIFSAPLPAGSGARALGFAGTFTAVADDATAASWNPAGLIQLERPEASFVLRYSLHDSEHFSTSEDFTVGKDRFESYNLNYLSVVLPFTLGERNFVFSGNYQEAYDFKQKFTASSLGRESSSASQTDTQVFTSNQVDHIVQGAVDINITSYLTTRVNSLLNQLLKSDMLTSLEFEQEGVIDAITPALAFEVTPKVVAGVAMNFYRDNTMGGHPIQSKTTARYSGQQNSFVTINDDRYTTGSYEYSGVWHVPPIWVNPPGIWLPAVDVPIAGAGTYAPFSGSSTSNRKDVVLFEGVFTEKNRFDHLEGFNLTLGGMLFINRYLTMGVSVDLPWTAKAVQTKTVENTITTYDATHTRVLNVSSSSATEQKNVEFRFPLYWAVGTVWKWNNVLSSCLDISQTSWSDFSYQAEGEAAMNPLDGSPHGEHPIRDCWSVKYGMEYLWVLAKTEIPFRAGVSWEQRPAIGSPDVFWGFSLGTGISIGREPGRLILDMAYNYAHGDKVFGSLVPDQKGLSTDATEQQLFFSGIRHF